MLATSARPSWVTRWRERCDCWATGSLPTTTSATGARNSVCCWWAGKPRLDRENLQSDPLAEMERIYKQISGRCDPEKAGFDQTILDAARAELVKIAGRRPRKLAIWREMIRLSQSQFESIYGRLGVKFDHTLGESFYNPRLKAIVDDLMQRGLATESRGAKAVFSDGCSSAQGRSSSDPKGGQWIANPFIIQKQDGGFTTPPTDLATTGPPAGNLAGRRNHLRDRWPASKLHFRQFVCPPFAAGIPKPGSSWLTCGLARSWARTTSHSNTRSARRSRLSELLDEAEERAFKVVFREELRFGRNRLAAKIARIVGLGAV